MTGRRDVAGIVLAGLSVVFLGGAAFLTASPLPAVPPLDAAGEGGAEQAPVLPVPSWPGAEAYAPVFEHPLFNPDRKPDPPPVEPPPLDPLEPAEPAAPPGPSSAGLTTLRLVGIAISEGGRVALLRREGMAEVLRLRPGDMIDGWKVQSVDRAAVTLTAEEQQYTIAFRRLH